MRKIHNSEDDTENRQFEQEPMSGAFTVKERHPLFLRDSEAAGKLFEQLEETERLYQAFAQTNTGADKSHSHRAFERSKKIEGIVSDIETGHTGYTYELFSTRPGLYAHITAISYRPRPKRKTITNPQNFFDIQGFRLNFILWRNDGTRILEEDISILLNTNNTNDAKKLRNMLAAEIDEHPDMDVRTVVQRHIDITKNDTKQQEITIE